MHCGEPSRPGRSSLPRAKPSQALSGYPRTGGTPHTAQHAAWHWHGHEPLQPLRAQSHLTTTASPACAPPLHTVDQRRRRLRHAVAGDCRAGAGAATGSQMIARDEMAARHGPALARHGSTAWHGMPAIVARRTAACTSASVNSSMRNLREDVLHVAGCMLHCCIDACCIDISLHVALMHAASIYRCMLH